MSEYATPDRVDVSTSEAIERLAIIPDYDCGGGPEPCVHTFRDSPIGLLGAHWSVEDARAAMDEFGCSEAGPMATEAHHGLVVIDKTGPVFFETKATRS